MNWTLKRNLKWPCLTDQNKWNSQNEWNDHWNDRLLDNLGWLHKSLTNHFYQKIMSIKEESETNNKNRFLMELEFIQCLANPQYLQCNCPLSLLFFYANDQLAYAPHSSVQISVNSNTLEMNDSSIISLICDTGSNQNTLDSSCKPRIPQLYSNKQITHQLFNRYPYSLEILELLQLESFRNAIASNEMTMFLHQKEFFHWQNAYKNSIPWTTAKYTICALISVEWGRSQRRYACIKPMEK